MLPRAAPTAMPAVAPMERPEEPLELPKPPKSLAEPVEAVEIVDVTTVGDPPLFACVTTTTVWVSPAVEAVASTVVVSSVA
jgi:hypothetical protein